MKFLEKRGQESRNFLSNGHLASLAELEDTKVRMYRVVPSQRDGSRRNRPDTCGVKPALVLNSVKGQPATFVCVFSEI
jgi:hypothetical protein